MDGVLANFESGFAPILSNLSGVKFPLDDPNFPPVWGWPKHYMAPAIGNKQANNVETTAWAMVEDDAKFWFNLTPMVETMATLKRLSGLRVEGHDIYFMTHRFGRRSKLQTEWWLSQYGMPFPTVIKTGLKGPVLCALQIDAFIDDKPANCTDAVKWGNSELARVPLRTYVFDKPYNQTLSTEIIRVKSVNEMIDAELAISAQPKDAKLSYQEAATNV